MYNVHLTMPSGAISRGYDRDKEEDAEKIFLALVRQMIVFDIKGSAVVTTFADEIAMEHKI